MGKRIGSSILYVPIWIITGLAIFILFSAIYDWVVRDVSFIRYGLMISSLLIIIISVGLGFVKRGFIQRQIKRQMGG